MNIVGIIFIVLILSVIVYFVVDMLIFTYKNRREEKKFQEYSIEQQPTFLPLSKKLYNTSSETSSSENSRRLTNGFYRMNVFRIP